MVIDLTVLEDSESAKVISATYLLMTFALCSKIFPSASSQDLSDLFFLLEISQIILSCLQLVWRFSRCFEHSRFALTLLGNSDLTPVARVVTVTISLPESKAGAV